ncbi:MAG TPA: hypothetical protein VJZ94_00595 [Candidatus Paceibacterota bacterium]|nr:hypothetical protein [Candidatus Paceibacterota bacterium]
MFDRQTKKFCSAVVDALPELSEDVMQGWIGNPMGLQKVLLIALRLPQVVPTPEPPLDFIIRVDRSVRPTYPEWMKKVMHPDLEGTGPAEYDLQRQIEEWPHDDQKTGVVSGNIIYKALKHDNALADQLGLADLFAIQVKGIAVFRKLFAGKAVFGWKSVVEDRCGHLYVPYLYEGGDGVVLYWSWLGSVWVSYNPALRFRK